jgi:hypothetical protein
MRNFLIYAGLFVVAIVAQLFVFDSIRVSIWFNPLVYIAFIALLPVGTNPVWVVLLGLLSGLFMDFFEGTAGLHTAATLFTAVMRRRIMKLSLGAETVNVETAMPSAKLLGQSKFLRYMAAVVVFHCIVFFSLEALTWTNYHLVLVKAGISAIFTMLATWGLALLFTVQKQKRLGT